MGSQMAITVATTSATMRLTNCIMRPRREHGQVSARPYPKGTAVASSRVPREPRPALRRCFWSRDIRNGPPRITTRRASWYLGPVARNSSGTSEHRRYLSAPSWTLVGEAVQKMKKFDKRSGPDSTQQPRSDFNWPPTEDELAPYGIDTSQSAHERLPRVLQLAALMTKCRPPPLPRLRRSRPRSRGRRSIGLRLTTSGSSGVGIVREPARRGGELQLASPRRTGDRTGRPDDVRTLGRRGRPST